MAVLATWLARCKSTLQCSAGIQQRKTFNMKKKKKIEDYQSDVTDNGRDMQSDHLNNTHLQKKTSWDAGAPKCLTQDKYEYVKGM